ncbi:hypothetical protein LGL08_07220 [Clostridium estertheticum]|uniref:hypothetical protein n=1 Tax=Clostridium estertheticum TaxID=238834 RepID=UPI001CF1781D|nr:hypothetical protein [Clostridium estertheticum]MCB2306259.1 hypothetical protein [Clostridium estertheticum]MCB2344432.1 hypothetical protein [Clostridium estertheticum]MCB2349351.1 hypothetical protein [Clostridium estertheticum]WAG45095.1 hypothetical protein LL127_16295 [Clostridium estertheticum]
MGTTNSYECLDCDNHCNDRPDRSLATIETSYSGLQNIVSNSPIFLGSVVDRTKMGRSIQLKGNRLIFSVPGLYLVTYSTSAVWTTLPYGTNEAIVQLKLNQTLLDGSETRVQVLTPQPVENQKSNLAKTVLVPVTTRNSCLTLISTSSQVMGFIDTTVTVVKVG